jgi:hypothetical protein
MRCDKGGTVRIPEPPPATSGLPELVTRRDSAGAPSVLVTSISAYPFAFPTAPPHDALLLHRPLRLATYALLGEPRVIETGLSWALLSAGQASAEWRARTLQPPGLTVGRPTRILRPSLQAASARADSRGGGADAALAAGGDNFGPEEVERVAECARLLRALCVGGPADALPALEALFDAVFPTGSLAPAPVRADTGAAVRPTALQARNEDLCRFMAVLGCAVRVAAHADAAVGERLAAQSHDLLARFAARRGTPPTPTAKALQRRP